MIYSLRFSANFIPSKKLIMNTLPNLKEELKQEYETTKKFIGNFPEGKDDYAPHEKSFKLLPLAVHIVEIVGWPDVMLNTEKLDFAANDYQMPELRNKQELLTTLDEFYTKSSTALNNIKEEDLEGGWKMTMGDQLIANYTKYSAIRHALSQLTHHRAQLGVYYRMNDIPLPGSYGPSADDQSF